MHIVYTMNGNLSEYFRHLKHTFSMRDGISIKCMRTKLQVIIYDVFRTRGGRNVGNGKVYVLKCK